MNQQQTTTQSANNNHISLCWLKQTKEAVIYLSLDFRIIEFNPIAEKIFGESRSNAIGQDYLELCRKTGIISPFFDDIPSLLAGEILVDIETICPQAAVIFSWKVLCALNGEKIADGYMLIGQDVTELKQIKINFQKAEEYSLGTNRELAEFSRLVTGQTIDSETDPLEQTKNIYRYIENIVARMPVSVYWMNKQGVYLGCNDNFAALFNLKSRHDIIGKTYKDLYDEESGKFYQSVDKEVINTGIAKTLEEPLFYPDGSKTIWLSSKVPLLNVSGQVIGMLGTSLEITERKKTEEALKEAKEQAEAASLAKSEFLAVISHELRIPITSILGMTQLLNEKHLTVSKQHEYLQHIFSAGMHLLNLINDTLDFAKLEAGQFQLSSAPIDLKKLIEETSTMVTPLAKAKNLELLINFEQNVPHKIFGDKRLLRQIIINLVGNAIKFTERGYVSIQVESVEKTDQFITLVISVNDTGIGIPEEKQGMIFDLFSQVDASHSRRHGGAGLGLTITKQLVELMSGTISVTSQVGKGTTFRCVIGFPLQNQAIIEAPWMAHESDVRVLIVDDTPRGGVIQRQLSASNSQVVPGDQAFNTMLAAQKLSDPYDVVILDQGLGTIDSFNLAKSIQQHHELHQPMLVVILDEGSANTKELAKAVGFFECITKPIQPLALQVALTAAWERWAEQKERSATAITFVPKLKVLLIEDEQVIKIIHQNYLEELDCLVELAANGKEALEKLQGSSYDLVFLDMGLPDINGIDVIKTFRMETLGKKQTPVISITAYGTESSKQEFLKAGVDEVMIKPVFREQLEIVLEKYCKRMPPSKYII